MLIHSSKQPRKNYQGRSFKNQDLRGVDFSYADIRGANFTGANLTNAKFNYALAGLTKTRIIIISIVTAILFITAGIAASMAVYVPSHFFRYKSDEINYIVAVIFTLRLFVNISLLVITIRKGISETIKYFFYLISLIILAIPILANLGMREERVDRVFRFFGISEAPDWVLSLTGKLRVFRGSSGIIRSANDLLNSNRDVSPFMDTIVTMFISIGAIFVLIFTFSLAVVLAEIIAEKWLANRAAVGIFLVFAGGAIISNYFRSRPRSWIIIILYIAFSCTLILIAQHLAKKILAEDQNNIFLLRLAVAIGTLGGTCFKNANLTDTDFSHATLKSTNFRFANTTRTFWRQTKYLKFARVEATILEDIKVRELLITGYGRDQQYISANLRGANLMSADLSNANFKLADLGEASLKAANLNNANLTETLAIGTNFTTAQMSGTCLEGWNIDHTTILDNIESKYIYLLEKPKPETDDRERRPSSGYFQKGDFTKLFQEVLNTVDLIFRNGVDAKAFMSSFQQVKGENQEIPMKIRGMEDKGDGVVVITIDVPPETNKEKIHQQFLQFYDKNLRVLDEKYQKELQETKRQINQNIQESERTTQIELAKIKKQNARSEEQKNYMMSLVNQIFQKSSSANYLVTLNFAGGSFATGFPVIRANIWSDSHPLPTSFTGNLPPNLKIPQLYQDWSQKYKQLRECYRNLGFLPRIKMKEEQTPNFSKKDIEKKVQEIISQIQELEKEWRSLINYWLDENNIFLLRLAIAIGTLGGTCFKNANLTDANFSHAILKSTDFRFANTTRTFWRQTKYLKFARVETTILNNLKVRDLLITGDGRDKQYIGANLRGANLISADLSNANFKLADLSESSLQAANLNNANLTETLARGTNFTTARMSGTCLEVWNIDHTTILDNVESKYIYLLEEPKPETDDRERRPSSGYFQKGDFTKLFQEVLNTVDLIFRNGVDAKAFTSSFKKVQVENQGIPMEIKSMENKGDGVIVVKIDVPPKTNKEKIHQEFVQIYDETVIALEEKYQKQLAGIEKQVSLYRRKTEETEYRMFLMNQILKTQTSANAITREKLVILNFEGGNLTKGFTRIKAYIWSDGHPLPMDITSNLPSNLEINQLYQKWSQKYQKLTELYQNFSLSSRIKIKKNQKINVSIKDVKETIAQIQELEKEWRLLLNDWLSFPSFARIENQLRTKIKPSDKVRLIIQSEDNLIQRLPWHLWNFFSDYQLAETAIALPEANRVEKLHITREKIRILAIFGDDKGINVEADKQYLSNFSTEAEIVSLVKPSRQALDEKLWDEKGWDILCFSGHSQSKPDGSTGYFDLGNQITITIEEFSNSLATTIRKGLKLAIFNSCDGLGLARQFARLHIPAIIVMREEVADVVAQKFLQNFLELFASGKSLYVSVREAREKLQVMEDKFPGASWLPVICQNPAEVPPSWE
ncbi:MAG: CHAT domain-containing protein [Okeania sp. SIO3B5]|uniref:pentapeptide repeat-containing protein n=1 Tax=Okeania sp. SIO3B5 TaxID=2607811 RepID=UPI001400E9BD|nr:pentapeptide repeat-containing protein [Okeania sp. SIO3B5]NEO57627.1 CHAT domain-containing protein [Okeania sp. SIO3B5]